MNTELFGVVAILLLTFVLAWPLGKYISNVFKGEKVWSDFLSPLENWILRICSIDPNESMDWKGNMKALLRLNLIFFLWSILVLMIQKYIPIWNPANIGNMEATLAYNTATSFVSNTNLQHYSGETGLSYLSQLLVIGFMQFVSAGTGIAALALLFKAGEKVRTLYRLDARSASDPLDPAMDRWYGRDDGGRLVPGGIYVLRVVLEPDADRKTRSFTVLR